jgi:hypothetical protein
MRTLFLILLFLVLAAPAAVAGGSSPDAPPEAMQEDGAEAAPEQGAEAAKESAPEADPEAAAEAAPATAEDAPKPGVMPEEEHVGPFGEIRLKDGTVKEVLNLKRFGKYYIYISGKLNGRSPMVVSLTRLSDLRRWTGIAFKDANTFTVVTKTEKELNFTDGHVYLGSDSTTDYTFFSTDPSSYMEKEMSVKKSDVQLLLIK